MITKIDSVLNETRSFAPDSEFVAKSNVNAEHRAELVAHAKTDPEAFWGELAARELAWIRPFTKVLNTDKAPFFSWFEDGTLNVSANCLDVHLETRGEKVALIAESDEGTVSTITYRALHARVCVFANALKSLGVGRGERVIIYMPMIPEAVIAMQACARIGAIHSVVFGGFSARSLIDRIVDANASAVITANAGMRGGKKIRLKDTVDEALGLGENNVKSVVVFKRAEGETSMRDGRDVWWHVAEQSQSTDCPAEEMGAEDPLFILYTSGSTGKPKGIQHCTGGYLLNCKLAMRWVFDLHDDDIFWCTADVGWVTGHSFICYGPLAAGGTQIIFEGVPTHPDANRFWSMIARHKVSIFYTAPTAIRTLSKLGKDFPSNHNLSSLRLIGTVGEPINPEAWIWYHEQVGRAKAPIVDTWWQTETGSAMISPLPGAMATKPGSCTLPLPGIDAVVIDENGTEQPHGTGGYLVIRQPWPSMLRTIWGDPQRYRDTYFPQAIAGGKYYVAGDSAMRDEDGYFRIMGRIDDVLNISGHRLGTMEIESALVSHPDVAEAAVVGRPDDVTGEAVVAFVVTQGDIPEGAAANSKVAELRKWVAKEIGPIAKPAEIRFGSNLPKTRSGKIMRRLLRSIACNEDITQDISTLENPAILETLKRQV